MKINQFKATAINQKSGIVVGKKTGDEIQDIAVFDGGTEDNNMKLMIDLKKFASQQELSLKQEASLKQEEVKGDWKKTVSGVAGGLAGGTGFFASSFLTANALEFALSGSANLLTIPTATSLSALNSLGCSPAGKAAILLIFGVGLAGAYGSCKLVEHGTKKLLGVEPENKPKEPGFFASAVNAFKS